MNDTIVELKCSCGTIIQAFISEEENYKDELECTCGKHYILLEVTEGDNTPECMQQ